MNISLTQPCVPAAALAPLLSWVLDGALGDPPNLWHPVAWQGRLLGWSERSAAASRSGPDADLVRLVWGGAVLAAGMGLSAAVAWGAMRLAGHLWWPIRLAVEAGLLKLAISSRGLDRAARQVETALRRGDLPEARRLLAWHLVSRDTGDLGAEEVAGAAVESVAENLTDSFVAPLCAYAAGGLPAVWAYRFAQTADSMWGYHDERHEWLGKPAARVDDVLNWLPARLAASLLVAATWLVEGGEAAERARRTRRSQARNTASPNAGQTMAAMAGALGVTLTKRGHYSLDGGGAAVTPAALARARRIVRLAAGLAVAGAAIISAGLGRRRD